MSDEHVLINCTLPAEVAQDPTLGRVADYLGLSVTDLQGTYGVVPLDKARGLFSVLIDRNKVDSISEEARPNIEGPFANPPIAPYGPVE